jgi:TolA-binding protein
MRQQAFVAFILILTIAWTTFYASVREVFNGVEEYKAQVAESRRLLEDERVARAIDREQFLDFQQTVASLMPEALRDRGEGEEGYPLRSLASTIARKDAVSLRQTIAKTLFEKGKDCFRKKEYEKANKAFRELIRRFSYTPYVTESYFLLSESQFQLNELEESVVTIQTMVEQFPQHELTGFALVRLGRIYELQNRSEEAVDIYKTVIRSFPQRDVASQAKTSLRGLDL